MVNWKTTVTACVTLLSQVALWIFKVDVPAETKVAMVTVGVFLIGLLAKDGNK